MRAHGYDVTTDEVCRYCGTDCDCCDWCGAVPDFARGAQAPRRGPLAFYKNDWVCDECVRADVDDQRAQEAKGHE